MFNFIYKAYLNHRLKTAIYYGYWLEATQIIERGANVNLPIKGYELRNNKKQKIKAPPLYWSMRYNQYQFFKTLLIHNADIHKKYKISKGHQKETCVNWAPKDIYLLELLKSGIMLHQYISEKSNDMVIHLIIKKLWINSFMWFVKTKSTLDARNKNHETIKDILEKIEIPKREHYKYTYIKKCLTKI